MILDFKNAAAAHFRKVFNTFTNKWWKANKRANYAFKYIGKITAIFLLSS